MNNERQTAFELVLKDMLVLELQVVERSSYTCSSSELDESAAGEPSCLVTPGTFVSDAIAD